jgi:hypothetical protein
VSGDTARQLSERFGKIMQDRESISINDNGISITRSKQLEAAVPPSKIATLSSGKFVGVVADDPQCKIDLKAFHAEIINDHKSLAKEQQHYKPIPVIGNLSQDIVQNNFLQIKRDIQEIIQSEMVRLMNDPEQMHKIVKKHKG